MSTPAQSYTPEEWGTMSDSERRYYNRGYFNGNRRPACEHAMHRLMNRVCPNGATYGEIVDKAISLIDGPRPPAPPAPAGGGQES